MTKILQLLKNFSLFILKLPQPWFAIVMILLSLISSYIISTYIVLNLVAFLIEKSSFIFGSPKNLGAAERIVIFIPVLIISWLILFSVIFYLSVRWRRKLL